MTDNIFNKPITGEVQHYSNGTVEQADPQLLVDTLDAALAVPGIEAVKWYQYTPYFNDGDPCEFRTGEVSFKFEGNDEGGDYDDGFVDAWALSYERDGVRPYAPEGLTVSDEDVAILREFSNQIDNGTHYVVLNKLFGDPAEVTATVDGFDVEYYEHD